MNYIRNILREQNIKVKDEYRKENNYEEKQNYLIYEFVEKIEKKKIKKILV